MHPNLHQRLVKVARILKLLKKLALTEGEFIERASQRSLEIMKRALRKIEAALNTLVSDPRARDKILTQMESVISPAGVVNQDVAKNSGEPFRVIRLVHQVAPQLAGPTARLMAATVFASRLQNADIVELAKADPRYREQFQRAQEKLSEALSRMDQLLSEIKPQEQSSPEAQQQQEQAQDTTAIEGVENQLREAEEDMRTNVQRLIKAIRSRVEHLFPDDTDLHDALDQNLAAAMPGGSKVNTKLNRDKSFYQDVLHMERGSQYDLGEFLTTSNKKLVYQAYRSLIMALRALGVVQWAKTRPDLVIKSAKARDLVRKAQQILKKRSELVVSKLREVRREEDKEEEEKGIPKGTFEDFFQPPKGAFDSAA